MNEQQHEIDQQKIRELEDNIKISSMQSMIVGQEKKDSASPLTCTIRLAAC